MLCLDCTFGVLVEVSSVRNTFFVCIYTVLLCSLFCSAFPPVGCFRLSSLVGEEWVVYYYLFLCGLLSLSLSVLGERCALVIAYY